MSKTYSAGIVTAYGAAKRAGYQGTYEDFCRQQAGYAESAAAVEQAKNTAVSAASTATTKATEATTAATAAQTAKTQTEAAASQALTDIAAARSGAISAVQTEGATQTANATAQAQAAATSANTASTKASEASASATSAGQSATNAAASATSAANAASAAQGVLESIPSDYSQMSADVTQLKADLGGLSNSVNADLSLLADMNSENIEELLPLVATYIETGADGASNYYKRITALSTSKEYIFVINVPTTDTYLIQCGSNSSASSMVDTVYNGKLFAGDNVLTGYVPTGAWIWARNDHNVTWSIKVYEKFESIAPIVFQNRTEVAKTPKVESISVATFSASPYNNLIGNLGVNTITSIIPSHNALDYPFGISGYYTVITTGESSSPIQVAIDFYGRMYRRKKSSIGWRDWTKEAIEYSNLTLTNSSVYSDFNDFPIGSIITVSNVGLNNSPEGYANTGHDVMDTGLINATVMTFATTPYDPFLKSQICIYYRQPNTGKPRIAYRSAMLISGNYTWTPWSMMSEDSVIHSTNRIVDINHLDYTFDDFDDAPINSIYQVDFNTGNSVAHNPAPGRSGSLMTYGYSNSSRHAQSQIYISRVSETQVPLMFFRYCVEVGTHEYQWSKWCQVNATADGDTSISICNKGRLANGFDFNNITDNSVYLLGGQSTAQYVNNALTTGGGYLTVYANGLIVFQKVEGFDGTRYSRYSDDSGSTWTSWI